MTSNAIIRRRIVMAAGFATAVAFAPGAAQGQGAVAGTEGVSAAERATLAGGVRAARASIPAAFTELADVRAHLPAADAARRGALAPVASMLRSLGADALWPMLRELAVEATPRGDLTDTAWLAWRAGLLEAVGALREPAAAPVLEAILDGPEREPLVVRAAVEALGKLGSDRAVARLAAMARTADGRRRAVLSGMGACRRAGCVRALSDAVDSRLDSESTRLAVRALGHAGSSWAWRTPVIAALGDERAVRGEAAAALMRAFVAHGGEVRQAASNSLMVVADPSTPTLIDDARRAAPDALRAELDALSDRFHRLATPR